VAKRRNGHVVGDHNPFRAGRSAGQKQNKVLREASRDDGRLSALAIELGLAGLQVLREEFAFSEEQATEWLEKMLARAKVNRNVLLSYKDVALVECLLKKGANDGDEKS
jgi:hypothetical protein